MKSSRGGGLVPPTYIYIYIYVRIDRCQSAFGLNLATVRQTTVDSLMPKQISSNSRIIICISLGTGLSICIGLVLELVSVFLYCMDIDTYIGISTGISVGSYICIYWYQYRN